MTDSRLVATVTALFVTGLLSPGADARTSAAPPDSWTVPWALAANVDGDVYVSFLTDTRSCVVRRFSADGALLATWRVSDNDLCDLGESAGRGVYVTVEGADVVRHYTKDGQHTAEWPVSGLLFPIASMPRNDHSPGEVWVIARVGGGMREVQRYGPGGDLRAAYQVPVRSYDLTVLPAGLSAEQEVWVVAARYEGGSWLRRYRDDGTAVGELDIPDDFHAAGVDFDPGGNNVWIALRRLFLAGPGEIQAYARDGTPGRRCGLTAHPIDLTVGANGDIYVLTETDPDNSTTRALHRYRQDCSLIDTWYVGQFRFSIYGPIVSAGFR